MTDNIPLSLPVNIIVGSMLGATEYVAESLQQLLKEHKLESQIHFEPEFNNIESKGTWIICSSTHGAGELPDNIQGFAKHLDKAHLTSVKFLVIALGDTSYDTFCQAGNTLYQLMINTQATPLSEIFCIDVLEHTVPEDTASEWLDNLLKGHCVAQC